MAAESSEDRLVGSDSTDQLAGVQLTPSLSDVQMVEGFFDVEKRLEAAVASAGRPVRDAQVCRLSPHVYCHPVCLDVKA